MLRFFEYFDATVAAVAVTTALAGFVQIIYYLSN